MTLNIKNIVFLTCTLCYNLIYSATWTWTGGTSTNFDTKSNWSTSSASTRPQSGDDVIINYTIFNQPQLVASRTIKNLTINGGTLDTRAYTLTVSTKTLINGGSITNTHAGQTGKISTLNFEIDNPNGMSLTSPGALQIIIAGTLTFTNGVIETTSDDFIIINDNAFVSNANNDSHVDGPIRKIGNDAFTFPIGNGSFYAPIGISDFSTNSTSQYTTAYYSATAPSGVLSGGGVLSSKENWVLNRSNVNQTSKITLFYNANLRSGGITDSSDLAVAVYNGTNWVSINGAAIGSKTIGSLTTANRVTGSIQGLTFSSPSGLNALPIELLDFSAQTEDKHIRIEWSTISEINNDFFTVEKSIDGKNWMTVSTLEAAENSDIITAYQSLDVTPVAGIQYYRLKQTDNNGMSTMSKIVAVNFDHVASTISLYPNPVKDILNIQLESSTEEASLVLTNAMGQKIMELNQVSGSSFSMELSTLDNGVYFLEVSQTNGITKTKIVKN